MYLSNIPASLIDMAQLVLPPSGLALGECFMRCMRRIETEH